MKYVVSVCHKEEAPFCLGTDFKIYIARLPDYNTKENKFRCGLPDQRF